MNMPDVIEKSRVLRFELGLSMRDFADRYGLSWETYRNWEDRRRPPDKAAELLLHVIVAEPELVARIVAEMRPEVIPG